VSPYFLHSPTPLRAVLKRPLHSNLRLLPHQSLPCSRRFHWPLLPCHSQLSFTSVPVVGAACMPPAILNATKPNLSALGMTMPFFPCNLNCRPCCGRDTSLPYKYLPARRQGYRVIGLAGYGLRVAHSRNTGTPYSSLSEPLGEWCPRISPIHPPSRVVRERPLHSLSRSEAAPTRPPGRSASPR